MSNTIKYLGDGSQFIAGVPARDLTEQEFNALPEEAQKQALESKLYLAPVKPAGEPKKVKETPTNG